MAVQTGPLQLRRLTTTQLSGVTPAVGEPVYDKTLKKLVIGDGVTVGGVVPSNASTADKLTTARNIALTGSVIGNVNFDGSANVSITTSVGASLQASLDLKAPLASPAFTGVPTAVTATVGTNTTQLATTAFVRGEVDNSPAWINLTVANGWTVIGAGRAVYRKVGPQLQVEFRVTGGTATDNTSLFTALPAGFRVPFDVQIPVVSAPNTALSTTVGVPRVVFKTDGTIQCINCSSAFGIGISCLVSLA